MVRHQSLSLSLSYYYCILPLACGGGWGQSAQEVLSVLAMFEHLENGKPWIKVSGSALTRL
jgi:hypothetical protein